MGTLSNYGLSALINHVFKTAYTPFPNTTLFLALCTSAPTVASTGSTIVETDFASYARKAITATDFAAPVAASRTIVQGVDLIFATATGAGSLPISHYAICDASTGGNMLGFAAFNSTFEIVSGNIAKVESGEIEISITTSSNGFTDIAVDKMLNLMFREIAWTSPNATVHFGLSTATIADTDAIGDVTECSGNNYAREPVPASSIDTATTGVTTNNTDITFDTPSGSWGLVTSLFIASALTAGDLLAYDNTNVVDQTPTTNDVVQLLAGSFDCALT